MDHILQIFVGSEMMSMLDGFSGYNQVKVALEDQHKMQFTTPIGFFSMDLSFGDMRNKITIIYLDDLLVFLKIELITYMI